MLMLRLPVELEKRLDEVAEKIYKIIEKNKAVPDND